MMWIPALATGFGAAAVDTLMSDEPIDKVFTQKRIVGALIVAGLASLTFGVAGTIGISSRALKLDGTGPRQGQGLGYCEDSLVKID